MKGKVFLPLVAVFKLIIQKEKDGLFYFIFIFLYFSFEITAVLVRQEKRDST